jgi:formylglycine-generating enzyme required for sulfatase activity
VSDFNLDKYEITVGRFRVFVNAGLGTQNAPPAQGCGEHPKIAGSGWSSRWNAHLAPDTAGLKAALKCDAVFGTWTDTPGNNENKPIECLDWYTAFAFCAWDGGRLPTYAEWNYAASGGSEHRYYPWSVPPTSETIDDSYAVYGPTTSTAVVGSRSPKGDAKWGQADLAGNVWEWSLDWYHGGVYAKNCVDCADFDDYTIRVIRGGDFYTDAVNLLTTERLYHAPNQPDFGVGARCARNP